MRITSNNIRKEGFENESTSR